MKGYLLRKALYGLKQSTRCWNADLDATICRLGFHPVRAEPCLYILRGAPLSTHEGAQTQTGADSDAEKLAPPDESDDNSSFPEFEFSEFPEFGRTDPELPPFSTISVLFCTWVDDIVLTGPAPAILNSVARALHDRFPLSDGGALTHILGIEVLRDRNANVFLAQQQYIEHVLDRFNHTSRHADPRPLDPSAISTLTQRTDVAPAAEKARYAELIGSLIYLSTRPRPDINPAVGFLSRFTANPSAAHWNALKRILRYLRGRAEYGLCFPRAQSTDTAPHICAYVDSDWTSAAPATQTPMVRNPPATQTPTAQNPPAHLSFGPAASSRVSRSLPQKQR
ncbi:MAG: hypothetical protein BJ554DRAFT_8387 [Olpidium bornovanus]|uniref:Reverse transcriptase Ty1/copia-type domain-containing protein n=1 Tax=Olpidium bornovanus TaxID=278681 RepID=A0A8H7ZV88_9FUNG|nr:MAG: hypothetical protein BJ554DRAFT_8387 [Olpidium bornovanus]